MHGTLGRIEAPVTALATIENADFPKKLSPWWKNKIAAVARYEIGINISPADGYGFHNDTLFVTITYQMVGQQQLCEFRKVPNRRC